MREEFHSIGRPLAGRRGWLGPGDWRLTSAIGVLAVGGVVSLAALPGSAFASDADKVIDEYQKEEEEKVASGEADALSFPRVDGEIVIELQNDYNYEAPNKDDEFNNLVSTIEGDFNVFFHEDTPGLFLNVHVTWEEVNDNFDGDDRYFKSQGGFIENLSLNYEADWWSLIAGKFGPNFSIAYDAAPGIYGTDLAEDDIELAERWGLGGSVTYDAGPFGAHALSGSTFFLDNSILSGSAIYTSRTRVKTNQGGPSNTESLESFALAIDGADISVMPGFNYQIGFAHQDVNRVVDEDGNIVPSSDTEDEQRVVVAGQWAIAATDEITVTPLLEWVRFWNGGGSDGEDRNYLTGALSVEWRGFSLAGSTTQRWTDPDGGDDFNDYLWSINAGYLFDFGLQLDVSYRFEDDDGRDFRTLGGMASYVLEF